MIWTLIAMIYVIVNSIIFRGELTPEFKIGMFLFVFLIGAIDFHGVKKDSR